VSPYQKKINEVQSNLSEILNKLIGGSGAQKPEGESPLPAKTEIKATCENCGLDFETYRESLFLGCAQCYSAFEEYLVSDLRRLHGSTRHTGKVPPRFRERIQHVQTINDLQEDLEKSIENEDFEKAAELRDKIRVLKEQVKE
jgi:protein arginine kinase activator